MASGGSIQPKISVYQYRVCTFKILLIILKTFEIFKGKSHEVNRELPVPCWCIPKPSIHFGQAGTKLLTLSWVLMQGLNPASVRLIFFLNGKAVGGEVDLRLRPLTPGLTHSWGGPISAARGISPVFPGRCRRVSLSAVPPRSLWHFVLVRWHLNTSPGP